MAKESRKNLVANRYVLLRPLGHGGMGRVYLAQDLLAADDGHREVALKFLIPTEKKPNLKAFKQEFSLLCRLKHPFLAQVFDFGFDRKRNQFYFTGEFIQGEDLFQYTRQKKLEEIYPLFAQICQVLSYIHQRGVLHNDLKPSNILVETKSKAIKLLDFGISSSHFETKNHSKNFVSGTPGYLSPEVLEGQERGIVADIYALGVVFIKILAGSLPFEGLSRQEIFLKTLNENILAHDSLTMSFSKPFIGLLKQMTARFPHERIQNSDQVLQMLSTLSGVTWSTQDFHYDQSNALHPPHFIGREKEIRAVLSEISQFFISPRQDSRNYLEIIGEEGAGKTRFLREISAPLQVKDFLFCWGRCPKTGTEPYQPWGTLFRQLSAYMDSAEEQNKISDVLFPNIENVSSKADSEIFSSRIHQALDDKVRFFYTFAKFLEQVSQKVPVLLALDDLHFISEESLDLLGSLLRSSTHKVLFVFTGNHFLKGKLQKISFGQNRKSVLLKNLTSDETLAMIESMLGCSDITDELIQCIFDFSRGSPGELERAIRDIFSRKWFQKSSKGLSLHPEAIGHFKKLQEGNFPHPSYLKTLGNQRQLLLMACTVFPKNFDLEEISFLLQEKPQTLAEKLIAEVERGFLRQNSSQSYEWAQSKERSGLYHHFFLAKKTRSKLLGMHLQMAKRYLNTPAPSFRQLDLACYHFRAAGKKQQLAKLLLQITKQSISMWAWERAEKYLQEIQSLLPHLSPSFSRSTKEILAELYQMEGRGKDALPLLLELIDENAHEPVLQAKFNRDLMVFYGDQGKYREALVLGQKSLKQIEKEKTPVLKSRLRIQMAFFEERLGRPENAKKHLERSFQDISAHDHPEQFGLAQIALGEFHFRALRDPKKALEIFTKAKEIFTKFNNVRILARINRSLASVYGFLADFPQEKKYYQTALEQSRGIGDLRNVHICLSYLGNLCLRQGQFNKSQSFYQEALTLAQHLNDRLMEIRDTFQLGRLAHLGERYAEGIDLYQRGFTLVKDLENQTAYQTDRLSWAALYLSLGDWSGAEMLLTQTKPEIETNKNSLFFSVWNLFAGELEHLRKSFPLALQYFQSAKVQFGQLGQQLEEADSQLQILKTQILMGIEISKNDLEALAKYRGEFEKKPQVLFELRFRISYLEIQVKGLPFHENYLENAEAIAEKFGHLFQDLPEFQVDFYLLWAECWEKSGNFEKALQTIEQSIQILENIFSKLPPSLQDFYKQTPRFQEALQKRNRYLNEIQKGSPTWLKLRTALDETNSFLSTLQDFIKVSPFYAELQKTIQEKQVESKNSNASAKFNQITNHLLTEAKDLAEKMDNISSFSTVISTFFNSFRTRQEQLPSYRHRIVGGKSSAMKRVFALLDQVSRTDVPVLIHGESGTGKNLMAEVIHSHGIFKDKPFIQISCGQLPVHLLESRLFGHVRGAFTDAHNDQEGLISQADGGSLFLDDVSELSPEAQAHFLRVLQAKEIQPLGSLEIRKVEFRLLASSTKNLRQWVDQGKFREDLFYRLHGIQILLPPLRERREDIPVLADHFLSLFSQRSQSAKKILTPSAMRSLCFAQWPGNVGQLARTLEAIQVLEGNRKIGKTAVTHILKSQEDADLLPFALAKKEFLFHYLTNLFDFTQGNVTRAAQISGISRRSLHQQIHLLKLENK